MQLGQPWLSISLRVKHDIHLLLKTHILHSPPTSSVTVAAEVFCRSILDGVNAMHWKVVPFQCGFVSSTRSPVYSSGYGDINSKPAGKLSGMLELKVITVPFGDWILHNWPPTPSTRRPPTKGWIAIVMQLNLVEPPHGTQVLLGNTWNAGKCYKTIETQ